MLLCSQLKFGICDIYNIFYAVLTLYFAKNLFMFYVNFIQCDHLITGRTII